MRVSGRFVVLVAATVVIAAMILWRLEGPIQLIALIAVMVVFAAVAAVLALREPFPPRNPEPDSIEQVEDTHRAALIRGTSKYLRDLNYRYSIRLDRSDREPFTTDINGLRLGFVPVVITDNDTDRQGYGYVAFVYDGTRWRGPGLPCGGGPQDAVNHATRCVAPLQTANGGAP
jgi:hypothetical protein